MNLLEKYTKDNLQSLTKEQLIAEVQRYRKQYTGVYITTQETLTDVDEDDIIIFSGKYFIVSSVKPYKHVVLRKITKNLISPTTITVPWATALHTKDVKVLY